MDNKLKLHDPCHDKIFGELREINDEQREFIKVLRQKANDLIDHLNHLESGRRKSIAITHLETAIMFATKAATYGD